MERLHKLLYKGDGNGYKEMIIHFMDREKFIEVSLNKLLPFTSLKCRITEDDFMNLVENLKAKKIEQFDTYLSMNRLQMGLVDDGQNIYIIAYGEFQPMLFAIYLEGIVSMEN